jgi:hypothetical protein
VADYQKPINAIPASVIERLSRMAATQSKTAQERKKIREKRNRRKDNLIKKANEYSAMCDADVCLGIRLKENSRSFYFPLRFLWDMVHPCLEIGIHTTLGTYVSIAIAARLTITRTHIFQFQTRKLQRILP